MLDLATIPAKTPADHHRSGSWLLVALSVLFLASGVSALIYQMLWLRLLGLVFGVTTYAASTVWASFMAGLAIGSLVAGRIADRVERPLMCFGACELAIGVTALATPLALSALQQIYVSIYPSLPDGLSVMTIARFLIAFAVLIVPTALMGATLPLVLKSSIFRTSRVGNRIGLLYGMNTAGAIVGALAAGLYLIQEHGIRSTFLIAAAINLIVGLSAIALGRVIGTQAWEQVKDADAVHLSRAPAIVLDRRRLYLVLAVFALSGFTSLALEVVWFRVLTLFLRPTAYGFALMLAAILTGIAAGSYLVTPFLDRRTKWLAVLGALEAAIGVAAVLSFGLLSQMSPVTARMAPWMSRFMAEWLVYPTVGSLLAIFPTALLMGAAFPVGLHLWAAGDVGGRSIARRIGVFYSLNLVGAIAGSLVAGFLMLPLIGSHASLTLLGALSLLSGLLLLALSELSAPARAAAGMLAVAAFAFAATRAIDPFQEFVQQRYRGTRIVWQEEGVEATSAVLVAGNGEVSLAVNGNHQASTGRAMVNTHRGIGHLPMVLHPEAREALVIGLGGGATAGAVAVHDGVDVDVVELAASVVRGAERMGPDINYGLFTRPNVHIRVDDGRNYMMLSRKKYDVVTADVILPIYAGSGNLYSAEYFGLMKNVLKPGGMALQWVNGTEAEYKTIARTFLSVFPYVTVWRDGSLLVGTNEPFTLRRRDFEWKLHFPGRARGARELGITRFEDLVAQYRGGRDDLARFVGPGTILTDDLPLVEYFLSLPRDRDIDLQPLHGDVREILEEGARE